MDTLFPMDDPSHRWTPDVTRPTPGVFLRKLCLLESIAPWKEIRSVPFHAGLNIVWADPKTEEAKKGASRLAGHSAGKTTFCRTLRWLLGEGRFGNDDLQGAVGMAFSKGWAALHVEIAGASWVVARAFWQTTAHWAVRADSIEEAFKSGGPEQFSAEDFFAALEAATVEKFVYPKLPGAADPLSWTDLLSWLARDQDAALQTVEAWRASTSAMSRNIAAKQSRHVIMRLVLELMETEEWKEKATCAAFESSKEHEAKRKPDLDAAAVASGDTLRYILGKSANSLHGTLLLAKATDKVKSKSERLKTLQKQLEALNRTEAEEKYQADLTAKVKLEQSIADTKKAIKSSEKRIAQREADQIQARQDEINRAKGAPPGFCGRKKEEIQGRCEFYQEAPQQIGGFQTAKDIAAAKDRFQEQLDEQGAELILAEQDLPLLTENAKKSKASLDEILKKYEDLQKEIAICEADLNASQAILSLATEASESRDANETETKRLTAFIRESNKRQRDIRDAHRDGRADFAQIFQTVLRSLTGDDTSGSIQYTADGLFELEAKTREKISSAAIEALKVVAFDLAAMFWSASGRGHHPRLLIHDSPRVADMSAVPYAAIFELVHEAEKQSPAIPNFQYIITTTESPPDNLKDHHLILSLDASKPEGRVFGRDF